MISGPEAYSKDWYDMRDLNEKREPAFVCGASDAGIICGVDKYKTRLQLYMELRGLRERPEAGENAFWGTQHEPTVLRVFKERTGYDFQAPHRLLMHDTHPMIGATPDGLGEEDDGLPITVDAKCTTSRLYDPEHCRVRDCYGAEHDEVPSSVAMQGQQQMLVTGAERCHFPVLFDGNNLRHYWINASPVLQSQILQNVIAFYHEVLSERPPEPDFEHQQTMNLIKNMYGIDPGMHIEFTDDIVPIFDEYVHAKDQIGVFTKMKERAQAKLLFAMGEASTADVPGTGRQMVRSEVRAQHWSQDDIDRAMVNLGQVKKRAYVRVTERKAK